MARSRRRRPSSPARPALTPLMTACLAGDVREVAARLRGGADVNQATPASSSEHQLLHVGFSVPEGGRTALMIAAGDMGQAHPQVVRLLLDGGARVDAVNATGYTALCYAARAGSREVVELLLARGADVDQRAMFRPLYCAADGDHVELVRHLLRRGADVDGRIWTGVTPLMAARSQPVLDVLLRAGADVALRDRDRRSAVHHAIGYMGPDRPDPAPRVRALLARGADPSAADRDKQTPLHLAAGLPRGSDATGEQLIRAGARLEARDAGGLTPLLRACQLNRLDLALRLLDAGARIEARDRAGDTPLLVAARNGYVDLGAELLARGARGRDRARAAAVDRGRDAFVRLLDGAAVPAEQLPARVREQCARAEDAYRAARYQEALRRYRRLPPTFRDRIFAVASNMGYCLQQLGRHRQATAQFELAAALSPAPAHVWKALCYAHFEQQRWDEMERCAQRAVELAPDDDYGWQQLAIARQELGALDGAAEAGRRAVALAPANAHALFNLADVERKLERDGYLARFAEAIRLAPGLRQHLDADVAAALGGAAGRARRSSPGKAASPAAPRRGRPAKRAPPRRR